MSIEGAARLGHTYGKANYVYKPLRKDRSFILGGNLGYGLTVGEAEGKAQIEDPWGVVSFKSKGSGKVGIGFKAGVLVGLDAESYAVTVGFEGKVGLLFGIGATIEATLSAKPLVDLYNRQFSKSGNGSINSGFSRVVIGG